MDDENPTEVTAGAIVTVTVTLIRRDMSTLFGDETAIEANTINENGVENNKEGAPEEPESQTTAKRPAWLKQKKGGGKKSSKEKKKQKHVGGAKHKMEESPAPPPKVHQEDIKEKIKEADDSAADESDVSDIDGNDDRSSDEDGKSSNVQDEDQVRFVAFVNPE